MNEFKRDRGVLEDLAEPEVSSFSECPGQLK